MLIKNFTSILLLILLCSQYGYAQQSADVNFSVRLGDFQSIVVNSSQKNVGVEINSVNEATNGKSLDKQNHIKVTSTSNYEIKVSTSSNLQGGNSELPSNLIKVTPSSGSFTTPNNNLNYSPVSLSSTEQTIISSGSGDIERSFNMNYFVSGAENLLNSPKGNYSTTISYSIVPN